MKTGVYINLDHHEARRESLLSSMSKTGLNCSEYQRFRGIEPPSDAPEIQRGLRTRGRAGIWSSMIAVLEKICTGEDFSGIVHILEDDTQFSPGFKKAFDYSVFHLLCNPQFAGIDIIYMDYFLTPELARLILGMPRGEESAYKFLPASKYFLACNASFLIRKKSAGYLATILKRILASGVELRPLDITIRGLFQGGLINGLLIAPLQSSPNVHLPDIEQTSIQTGANLALRNSQNAHLLLRKLLSEQMTSDDCVEELSGIFGVKCPANKCLSPSDFIDFFEVCQKKFMVTF